MSQIKIQQKVSNLEFLSQFFQLVQIVIEADFDSENGLFGFDNLVFGTDKKCIPRWAISNFKQVMPILSNLGLSNQNEGGV